MMIGYLYNNLLPARAGEAARVDGASTSEAPSPAVEITGTAGARAPLSTILGLLAIFFLAAPWLPHVQLVSTPPRSSRAVPARRGVLHLCGEVLAIFGERPAADPAVAAASASRR